MSGQFVYALTEQAKKHLKKAEYLKAIDKLTETLDYPESLGEGKLVGVPDNIINYYLGCAYVGLKREETAKDYFLKATVGLSTICTIMINLPIRFLSRTGNSFRTETTL